MARIKFLKPAVVTVSKAAKLLGCHRRQVFRCIEKGQLTAQFLPGAGLTAARRIPYEQVVALAKGKHNLRLIDTLVGKPQDWDERNRLLQAKAIKLAEARGPQVVLDLLSKLGAARITDLDEQQQRRFNGMLLRAAGYIGDGRTTAWKRRKAAEAARAQAQG